MPRIPLPAGSRLAVVPAPDDAVLLGAPPPLDPIADLRSAVRESLRYPLSGAPLAAAVTRGSRATVVVEPPILPLPAVPADPRREALATVLGELVALGVPSDRQTIVVAGGLERRAGRRSLEALLPPAVAREFRGSVVVHDAADPGLVPLGATHGVELACNRALVETDLVVTVSAAETVLHGGPAALLAACSAQAVRAATAESLLETSSAPGWRLATAVERELAQRVPVLGTSLVLDHPRATGRLRGYPGTQLGWERAGRLRVPYNALPGELRRRVAQRVGLELRVAAAFAGPPSVAHVEALLRGVSLRAAALPEPVDAIVVPLPWKSPHHPRARHDPVTASYTALGVALRLWRDAFPVREGGTAILLHSFERWYGHAEHPYLAVLAALGEGDPGALTAAEAAAAADERLLDAYRAGRAPHPLLPFADWAACAPVLRRLGCVVVAGCRDATAARTLGFVPSHNVQTAIDMASGLAGGDARIGVLLAPPYPPLVVG